MLLMVEKSIRGGICQAIRPNIKANNKYMTNYDKSITQSYLQYLDENNLCGWTMCKKLPYSDFCWIDPNACREDVIKIFDENDDFGAILEVDIEYSQETKIKHKDLAFLPEKRKINGTTKLVTTLYDKKNYVVHISALKQALNHGLKFKKVQRIIEFEQKAWMKPYIELNTDLRTNAKNEFEKKLLQAY